ncbi:kelch motif family protein [Stylonychia lemnae]|uniref:Kelch motif family protein n=1 Tax=Stylonychia lemnae TaxID=5949 RepID=A0A078AS76_STYLE|nr:kelch motif family protein [Stylonychia lemnae]|eukprot:CDW85029.1 kelch motif family protein [Stylonychia lemnae]
MDQSIRQSAANDMDIMQAILQANQNMQAQSMIRGDHEYAVRQSDAMNLDADDALFLQNQSMNQSLGLNQLGSSLLQYNNHSTNQINPAFASVMRNTVHNFNFQQNSSNNNNDIFDHIIGNNSSQIKRNQSIPNEPNAPLFCSLHGRPLEFFCFDDKQRICQDCVKNQHKTHRFNFINVCATINKELLDLLKSKSLELQLDRKIMQKDTVLKFKKMIREEVLKMKDESKQALEDACSRILQQINRGELRNIEREVELFQSFFFHKIQNFNYRIRQATDQISKSLKEEKYLEVMLEKDKIESFDQELQLLGDQIKQKKEYFKTMLVKLQNQLDLSSFQQVRERAEMAQRSLELFSKENRIAVFVPNKKQIIMHDLKYFTQKTLNIQEMEHTFGNFSTILQSSLNSRIYVCGGKQRKKLFEYDERNGVLIEKSEMHYGRSNHAFVEVTLTGELIAIGGWDGEKSMSQAEGFAMNGNSWRHLPRLVEERHSLSACRLGDSFVYAIGGSSAINYGSSLSTIERLNFASPHFEGASHWELIFLFGQYCDAKRSQLGSVALTDSTIMLFGGFMDTDLTNMCFKVDTNTFEITKMDCVMKKSKKFIKFKDYTIKINPQQYQGFNQGAGSNITNRRQVAGNLVLGGEQNLINDQSQGFVYIVDDENEIHQYDITRNQWFIVETNREN